MQAQKQSLLPANWGNVSISVGFSVGFIWMACESFIHDAQLILAIFFSGIICYYSFESLRFKWVRSTNMDSNERQQHICNTRDLGLKIIASVAGWMCGYRLSQDFHLSVLYSSLIIGVFDSISIGIVNLFNEFSMPLNQRSSHHLIFRNNFALMITAFISAITWYLISLIHMPILGASFFNGAAIGIEFYFIYQWLACSGGVVS